VNPEQFDEFARALFEEVGKTENVEERLAKWMSENKKYYPNMAQAEFKALAREEVVAEMCESFLTDEKVVQRISQKVYEADKGLWNTIKKWFEDLVAKLKKLFADLDPQSENGRIVREMGDRLNSVRQMWADMVVEAGEIATESTQEQVKNSRKDLEKLDADYLSAVERGDMETAQGMVDEAAKKAGYTVKGYHGSHNSFTIFDEEKSGLYGGVESRIGFWFGTTKKGAENWANETWGTAENNPQVYDSWLKIKNPKIFVTKEADSESIEKITKEIRSAESEYNTLYEELRGLGIFASWTVSEYIRTNGNSVISNLHNIDENTFSEAKRIAEKLVSCNEKIKQLRATRGELIFTDSYEQFKTEIYKLAGMDAEDANVGGLGRRIENGYEVVKKYRDNLISQGYDGIIIRDTRFDADTLGEGKKNEQIVVFAPNQIKSAEPVTYDDKGNVIPLSQRFNEENEDIRYSRKGVNKDGIEVYETSEETMKLTWKEREAKYLDLMKNEYRGRTAKFIRNGHTFYAQFDPKGIRKVIKGDSRSKGNSLKALIKAGADGDIFELVERSKYTHSSKNRKNHTPADYFDYFVKTVQIDGKVFDLIADVEKMYGGDGGYVYTLALTENKTIKASPAHEPPEKVSVKGARNASNDSIAQNTDLSTVSSKKVEDGIKSSRKTVDPITSREELAKALSKVANAKDRAIVESYKANVNLIKGETARLESLRKEIDEIKYKKSITYEGRELSVKEFEQIAYTRAEEKDMEIGYLFYVLINRLENIGQILSLVVDFNKNVDLICAFFLLAMNFNEILA